MFTIPETNHGIPFPKCRTVYQRAGSFRTKTESTKTVEDEPNNLVNFLKLDKELRQGLQSGLVNGEVKRANGVLIPSQRQVMTVYNYEFVKVEQLGDFVVHVALNRPKQVNALHDQIWFEIGDVFDRLDTDDQCRAIILTGEGKGFCSGIDLKGGLQNLITLEEGEDIARKSRTIRRKILKMQDAFTRIEHCCKPVIAAVHGVCLGAGIDIISACDIRYCSKDVVFSVKEVDIGLAADVGSLNRLPKIIGNDSWLREVSLTARHFGAEEAQRYDLVSGIFESKEKMLQEATSIAKSIALKSPVAIQGTKVVLNYSRDHTIAEGLDFVATWNASQLLTEDIPASAMSAMMKQPLPPFSKL